MKKIILLGSVILLASSSAYAGMYKWTDEAGNVHYSSTIPASASKKAHTKIEARGIVKTEVDPLGVIKAAQAKKASLDKGEIERLRLEKIKNDERIKRAEKQKRDDYLLTTFNSKDELIHYFENKIKMVEGESNIYETYNIVLKKKVVKLEAKRKVTKHKTTLGSIEKKIVDINTSIETYNQALQVNSEKIATLTNNYQVDMKRYSELTQ